MHVDGRNHWTLEQIRAWGMGLDVVPESPPPEPESPEEWRKACEEEVWKLDIERMRQIRERGW